MKMNRVLVAGATGYLGKCIAKELKQQDFYTRVLVRSSEKFEKSGVPADEIVQAQVTNKSTLEDCWLGSGTHVGFASASFAGDPVKLG